jgi:uncharacterized protein YkwD
MKTTLLDVLVICTILTFSFTITSGNGIKSKLFKSYARQSTYALTDCTNTFNTEILAQHNIKRALHVDTPALNNSLTALTEVAQGYSKYLEDNNLFEHSVSEFGENLYTFASTEPFQVTEENCKKAAADAVNAWYDEIKFFNWEKPSLDSPLGDVGHFTQVIWRDTQQVGCGLAIGDSPITFKDNSFYKNYVVCNYEKAGNFVNALNENLKPLKPVTASSANSAAVLPVVVPEPTPFSEEGTIISQSKCFTAFDDEMIAQHRAKRDLHISTNKLTYKTSAINVAQANSDNMKKTGEFKKTITDMYGENIYTFTTPKPFRRTKANCALAAKRAVTEWYDEIKNYNWTSPTVDPKVNGEVSSFAQIVWSDSYWFGCGFTLGDKAEVVNGEEAYRSYIACDYRTPLVPWAHLSCYIRPVKPPQKPCNAM